jgi:23S rRNA (uridine2552-2'-O)-methyltransferase
MSKLSDRRNRHDVYHRRARQQGFLARAVFKLEEIDHKVDLLRHGDRVLDLGCAPGSWLQYCHTRVGSSGRLVGIDELRGDLAAFDVVLSDMAPDTTGVRHLDQARSENLFERALDLSEALLAPGGSFVGKLFQGPAFPDLVKRCRSMFETVKIIKPKGSRQQSIEQYVVGRGYRGPASTGA